MSNRRMLYGYQVQDGVLTINGQEGATVERITTLYLEGFSYQRISDVLNQDKIPFGEDAARWNKHKVKRLLENPRYTGTNGYPPIITVNKFHAVQQRIRDKTANYQKRKPALKDTAPDDMITAAAYIPSGEAIRLSNAINRGLEHPDVPENVVALILRGISARYDCLK